MTISFVIPVRDDATRLRRCIRSIKENVSSRATVEIIVVDNGSSDDSVEVARAEDATVLQLPQTRLGELRNGGAAAAHGDVLAFVDADNEIAPDWVQSALEALAANHKVGAVGAPYSAPAPGTWVQQLYDRLRPHPSGRIDVDWLWSGNMAISRSAFEAVGGFDTALETCEDVDLCRKLRARGYAVLADSRLENVHHGDPKTLRHVFLGELWRGRDNVRVSLRAPRSFRTVVSAAISIWNLLALAVIAGGLLAGTRGGYIAATTAAMTVFCLVALRAARMVTGGAIWSRYFEAFAVAGAYELGRTLSLVARTGYGRRRAGATT